MSGLSSIQGLVAVVTGAASGIGRALAREFVSAGARVALVDRNDAALAETATELGEGCSTHVVDVSDREAMRALPTQVLRAHGQVNLLVNNAGVATMASFLEQDLDELERMMNINFMGIVHGCRFFAPALRDGRPACIVNNASILGMLGVAGRSAYCASKFAVRGFSEALAQELSGTGIGVTVVYAGAVNTNIHHDAYVSDERIRERFMEHFEQHGLEPERAAGLILRAIQKGRPRVFIGPDARAVQRLKRLAPIKADRWLNDAVDRQMGMAHLRAEARERFLRGSNTPDAS